ncbi:MAG: hypothetical protein ACT4QF_15355 [Sporichthyaceae bacterium]
MNSRDAKRMLGVLWFAAASIGVLIGAVSVVPDEPPSRLLSVLLILATAPFGLLRPSIPWLWGAVVAWPTVVLGVLNTGWVSVLMLIPAMIGVYMGDWIATWWAEAHPSAASRNADAEAAAQRAADGTAVAEDGLPPVLPDRWSSNLPGDGR